MKRFSFSVLVFAVSLWTAAPAEADLQAGIAAFEAGDAESAVALLAPEAEAGNVQAQFLMGELLSGGAVPRDLAAATEWYQKAAEGGVAEAQFQLGMRYSVGLGLDQDLVQAYRWLTIAGQFLKTEAAGQFVQTFVGKMSEDEVAEASALVAAWQAPVGDDTVRPATGGAASGGLASAVPAPEASALSVADAMQTALEAHPCSDVRLVDLANDRWQLAGLVENTAAEAGLIAAMREAVAAEKLETELTAVGRPICAAAAISGRFRDHDRMVMVAVDGKTDFADGEIVEVDLTLPDVPGYLYVDYYQLDGQVVHVLPLADVAGEKTIAGGRLRLGDGGVGLTLRVGPPFGKEMLTAFVVSEPLFTESRAMVERAEDYLLAMARRVQMLDTRDNGQVLADALLITTIADE